MELSGKHLIGAEERAEQPCVFSAIAAESGEPLATSFAEATLGEVDAAARLAEKAVPALMQVAPEQRAGFLEACAAEIEGLGDSLIVRAMAETGLPEGRLKGERGRTCNQLRLFAKVVREGRWLDARVDRAQPDREPFPKPDVRSMLRPMGPVAIFGASNFPLAFSVAGGDTASALAAGCPVVVKAHPAHPGTSELVGRAMRAAVKASGLPEGTFSLLHGTSHRVGRELVEHPSIQAVGFTGSLQGGRALLNLAAARPQPIPVYAEMGSINPVFILPEAMKERNEGIAAGLAGSITLGVGQFCTNPGLVLAEAGEATSAFAAATAAALSGIPQGTMLTSGIRQAFETGVDRTNAKSGVQRLTDENAQAVFFQTDAETFAEDAELAEEVFGPSSLLVTCDSRKRMLEIAERLEGHLTATIHGTEEDLAGAADLIAILERKVGRIVINGYPTGVEVCHAMIHGGPYPATTDSRSTSVGTAAITRFARPVCFQNMPDGLLPPELQEANPYGVPRMEN